MKQSDDESKTTRFMGKVLITGADRGLGLALVKRFLASDYQVFAGVYETDVKLSEIDKDQNALVPVPLDVTDMLSVHQAAQYVAEQTARLDLVINNAGIHLKDTPQRLEELDFQHPQFIQTYQVNPLGRCAWFSSSYHCLKTGTASSFSTSLPKQAASAHVGARKNMHRRCQKRR